MSFISVFDVLGPNMIGPSSSHTAGAARIAYLAQKMINGPLVRVDFTLYGSFARTYRGHGTDRALLGGIMGFDTDDMRIRDSFRIAEEIPAAHWDSGFRSAMVFHQAVWSMSAHFHPKTPFLM